ncbi:hypothetical protein PR202_gb25354 [Eleusine coracana subsp. coracana]|uniref:Ubiquitin-like protease family profile domain-containing protein n=1 Tax=Eleusine coracana subsp. coracana TaxID=191504 RepID=A0AAV5FNC5_ELECO|nr:hypothetical protein PR202_gb25309 [Eleusine coracana subsp. coracana]GJN36491.1 hypothetical protein PR202_gb25354 [Eleusine coracana subsp. coracana]
MLRRVQYVPERTTKLIFARSQEAMVLSVGREPCVPITDSQILSATASQPITQESDEEELPQSPRSPSSPIPRRRNALASRKKRQRDADPITDRPTKHQQPSRRGGISSTGPMTQSADLDQESDDECDKGKANVRCISKKVYETIQKLSRHQRTELEKLGWKDFLKFRTDALECRELLVWLMNRIDAEAMCIPLDDVQCKEAISITVKYEELTVSSNIKKTSDTPYFVESKEEHERDDDAFGDDVGLSEGDRDAGAAGVDVGGAGIDLPRLRQMLEPKLRSLHPSVQAEVQAELQKYNDDISRETAKIAAAHRAIKKKQIELVDKIGKLLEQHSQPHLSPEPSNPHSGSEESDESCTGGHTDQVQHDTRKDDNTLVHTEEVVQGDQVLNDTPLEADKNSEKDQGDERFVNNLFNFDDAGNVPIEHSLEDVACDRQAHEITIGQVCANVENCGSQHNPDAVFSEESLDTAFDLYMTNDIAWRSIKLILIPVIDRGHYSLYAVNFEASRVDVLDTLDYDNAGTTWLYRDGESGAPVITRLNALLQKKSKEATKGMENPFSLGFVFTAMVSNQAPDSPEHYTVPCSAPDLSPRVSPPPTTAAPGLTRQGFPSPTCPDRHTPPATINSDEMATPDPQQTYTHVTIVRVVLEHNHPLTRSVPVVQNMECHKNRDGSIMELVDTMQTASVRPSAVRNVLSEIHGGEHLVPVTSRDLENRSRKRLIRPILWNPKEEHERDDDAFGDDVGLSEGDRDAGAAGVDVGGAGIDLPRLRQMLEPKLRSLHPSVQAEVQAELQKYDDDISRETAKIAAAHRAIKKKQIELVDKLGSFWSSTPNLPCPLSHPTLTLESPFMIVLFIILFVFVQGTGGHTDQVQHDTRKDDNTLVHTEEVVQGDQVLNDTPLEADKIDDNCRVVSLDTSTMNPIAHLSDNVTLELETFERGVVPRKKRSEKVFVPDCDNAHHDSEKDQGDERFVNNLFNFDDAGNVPTEHSLEDVACDRQAHEITIGQAGPNIISSNLGRTMDDNIGSLDLPELYRRSHTAAATRKDPKDVDPNLLVDSGVKRTTRAPQKLSSPIKIGYMRTSPGAEVSLRLCNMLCDPHSAYKNLTLMEYTMVNIDGDCIMRSFPDFQETDNSVMEAFVNCIWDDDKNYRPELVKQRLILHPQLAVCANVENWGSQHNSNVVFSEESLDTAFDLYMTNDIA